MARGDTISTTVPSVGDAETQGTTDLLTILSALVTIAETKVTPSEIDMDATLDFNSQAGENVKYFEFVTQVSDPATAETLYTKNDGATDELYFQNGSGSVVQITNGGALNVAATGSVTGAGYGSGGVAVNWNSAGTNYQFKSGSGADDYAALTADGLQLRDGSSHAVTLDSPALAADYTITFANAVPGSESFLTLDNSGQLAYADNATPYTNFKHAGVQVMSNPASSVASQGTWDPQGYTYPGDWHTTATSATQTLQYFLNVKPGDEITQVYIYIPDNNASVTFTFRFRKRALPSGATTTIDTISTFNSTGTATWDVTDTTVAAGELFWVEVEHTGTASNDVTVAGVAYSYKR